MPIFTYVDDVVYDGRLDVFRSIAFCASLCAVLSLKLAAQLQGDPVIFYPVNATLYNVNNFNTKYREAFNALVPFFENGVNESDSDSDSYEFSGIDVD